MDNTDPHPYTTQAMPHLSSDDDDDVSNLDISDSHHLMEDDSTLLTSSASSEYENEAHRPHRRVSGSICNRTDCNEPPCSDDDCSFDEFCRDRDVPSFRARLTGTHSTYHTSYRRVMNGAWVDFDQHAGIRITLPSDLSAVCISGFSGISDAVLKTDVRVMLGRHGILEIRDLRVVREPSSIDPPRLGSTVIVTFLDRSIGPRVYDLLQREPLVRQGVHAVRKIRVRGPHETGPEYAPQPVSESILEPVFESGLPINPHSDDLNMCPFLHEVSYDQVYCSWNRRERTAIMTFHNQTDAVLTREYFETGTLKVRRPIDGSRNQGGLRVTTATLDGDLVQGRGPFVLRVTDVGPYATVEDVLVDIPHDHAPTSTVIITENDAGPLPYDHKTLISCVLKELRASDGVEQCEVAECHSETAVRVKATFSDDDSARAATMSNSWMLLNASGMTPSYPLHPQVVHTVVFRIPAALWTLLGRDITRAMGRGIQDGCSHHLQTTTEGPSADIDREIYRLTIWGPDWGRLVTCKREVERITRGVPVAVEPQLVKLDLFTMCQGCLYDTVYKIGQTYRTIVVTKEETGRIYLHGRRNDIRMADTAIRSLMARRAKKDMEEKQTHAVDVPEERALMQTDSPDDCFICFDDDCKDPIMLPCGHTYCRDCFERICRTAAKESEAIRCLGIDDVCKETRLPLRWLHDIMPPSTFEKLLRKYMKSYQRNHAREIRHCPTQGCDFLYRVTPRPLAWESPVPEEEREVQCRGCRQTICTICHSPPHPLITCDDYQAAMHEWEVLELQREREERDSERPRRSRRLRVMPAPNVLPGGFA